MLLASLGQNSLYKLSCGIALVTQEFTILYTKCAGGEGVSVSDWDSAVDFKSPTTEIAPNLAIRVLEKLLSIWDCWLGGGTLFEAEEGGSEEQVSERTSENGYTHPHPLPTKLTKLY